MIAFAAALRILTKLVALLEHHKLADIIVDGDAIGKHLAPSDFLGQRLAIALHQLPLRVALRLCLRLSLGVVKLLVLQHLARTIQSQAMDSKDA